MNIFGILIAILLSVSMSACSIGVQKRTELIPKRVDTVIPDGLKMRTYKINVRYFSLSDIGYAKSVDEIESVVTHFDAKEHGNYYRWDDYRIRHFDLVEDETPIESGMDFDQIKADDNVKWKTLDEGVGFSYFVADTIAENGQLTRLPNVDFAQKNIDGFRFYLNLIDFHMWDIYSMSLRNSKNPSDPVRMNKEAHVIELLKWENVVKKVDQTAGSIYLKKIGLGENAKSSLYYFQQSQRLDMLLLGPIRANLALEMPYHGSNRFGGFFEMDDEGRVMRAQFNEYIYGKVSAPFFIKMPAYTKREYTIERTH